MNNTDGILNNIYWCDKFEWLNHMNLAAYKQEGRKEMIANIFEEISEIKGNVAGDGFTWYYFLP